MSAQGHAVPGTTPPAESAAVTRRVTAYSVLTALILVGAKAVAWSASGSVALLSSLADSTLDLVASLGTFLAVRYAVTPPDAEHRFGHGKAEAFASLVQACLVFASAALVGREAVARLADPRPVEHGGWALAVMGLSIALTLLLVAAQTRALKKTGSVAVSGDRAHYFADLASNLAAVAGIAGATFLSLPELDAFAGLAVSAWLVWGAIGVLREAADHLMDKGLPVEARARIVELALADPQMTGVHQLRTRVAGPYVMIQFHADLDPALTLEAAHAILVEAENRILAEYPAADILIHPDPRGRAEPHGGAFQETAAAHSPQATPES
ncbi:cation diffusion facilitator family transporter [Caulobacter sp. 17J80-11]|uniref:cation diffusion facilitator family transporter n=1 Tax=Caulobacter sp. 17J80-11 TaxID=2763502 RepID=UPI0016538984|nr:cation diffusion facilitator family transporter [Caulobacter sp. 17J80-11]MBC6983616.1 cation transporter [Caulobacter sp. 17J80-11]